MSFHPCLLSRKGAGLPTPNHDPFCLFRTPLGLLEVTSRRCGHKCWWSVNTGDWAAPTSPLLFWRHRSSNW